MLMRMVTLWTVIKLFYEVNAVVVDTIVFKETVKGYYDCKKEDNWYFGDTSGNDKTDCDNKYKTFSPPPLWYGVSKSGYCGHHTASDEKGDITQCKIKTNDGQFDYY